MSRKQEIWNTYLQMKRNNSSKLSEFLSNDENKRVVKQKDYQVVSTPRSNIYHREGCSHLSRSRTLHRASRSDAIIHGKVGCSRCIKDFELDPLTCIFTLICIGLVAIISVMLATWLIKPN